MLIAVHLDLPLSKNRNDYHPQHMSDLKHKYCLSVLHNFQYNHIKVVLTHCSSKTQYFNISFSITRVNLLLRVFVQSRGITFSHERCVVTVSGYTTFKLTTIVQVYY